MKAPKEIYLRDSSFKIPWSNVINDKQDGEYKYKYLRSDLAVDREKLVRDMENMRDSIKALKIDNDFNDGRLAILEELIEKLKEL